MKKQIIRVLLSSLLLLTLFKCHTNNDSLTNSIKFHPNDPFKSTIVPSQSFEIDGKKDNIIEGENGTIIVCPKGCFKNVKGEIVEENVKVELSEALTLEEMVLSNLTTTSNGKPLETDGMIYFNATKSDGELLMISKDNPIHIEIPTTEKKSGMMAYKGIRDEKGNMNWTEPKELDKFLIPIDIDLLDFLPSGFQTEVNKGMPFRNYKTSTKNLTDSLYYSLSVQSGIENSPRVISSDYNESYYNRNKKVVNGKYTNSSSVLTETDSTSNDQLTDKIDNCGIDPAIIKVIRSKKYQNTLIATREFEARLKVIFKTCKNSVLEIYINNLDKNLFELDSMASKSITENEYSIDFYNFYQQRLTNVKDANKYSNLLNGYFNAQLLKIKAELEKSKEKAIKDLNKKNIDAQKEVDKYKQLLQKREKHRMETYGFNWTETGWINIDNGTLSKDWGTQPLEIKIDNGKGFDRVYTYVVYSSIKSLYRLNTQNNDEFFVGNDEEKQMLMPEKQIATAIAIGYKGENISLAIKAFETGTDSKFTLSLLPSSLGKVKEEIKSFEKYGKENRISKDLEFMAAFYKEEQRQINLQKEIEFIKELKDIAFPCCSKKINGEELFFLHCKSCHNADKNRLVGPGLAESTTKYSKEWLYKWTTNSGSLIKSGDQKAIKVYTDYNRAVQPKFDLTKEEVIAIYKYIDEFNSTY